jgi:predicted nucleotidyltransferase
VQHPTSGTAAGTRLAANRGWRGYHPFVLDEAIEVLRRAGARFVFLHGSRATGTAVAGSDHDLAASFGDREVDEAALQAALPAGCDLLILDGAPLELAGRVAM